MACRKTALCPLEQRYYAAIVDRQPMPLWLKLLLGTLLGLWW
jgi:hypothetical protein